jgi:Ca2+-binding RTX toxin-like protein
MPNPRKIHTLAVASKAILAVALSGSAQRRSSIFRTAKLSLGEEMIMQFFNPDLDILPNGVNLVYGSADNDNPLSGTAGRDAIFGYGGHDRLYGLAGNDQLEGGDGHDTLDGGSGTDRLEGGIGNDTLRGGDGIDYFFGGYGSDTVDYTYSAGGWEIDLSDGTARSKNGHAQETLSSIENAYGGAGRDDLRGTNGNNTLHGYHGDDHVSGLDGDDRLYGGNGRDHLAGGRGADVIGGGAGDDRLWADGGEDVLTGGTGRDTFHFELGSPANDNDTVTVTDLGSTDRIKIWDIHHPGLSKGDLDSNGDGTINAADADFSVVNGNLVYDGEGGDIVFEDVAQFDADQLIA